MLTLTDIDLKYGLRSHLPRISMVKFNIYLVSVNCQRSSATHVGCVARVFKESQLKREQNMHTLLSMCYLHFPKSHNDC